MKISFCMITWNEEQNLPIILALVAPFVDDIVIVDSWSTDRTRFIAEQFKAKVIIKKFENDYAAQRNAGLEIVEGDWILSLDGDEFPSPQLCMALRETIRIAESGGCDTVAYSRMNYTSGVLHNDKEGEDKMDMHVKLFKRGLRYDGWHSEGIRSYRKRFDCPNIKIFHMKSLERGVEVHNRYRDVLKMPSFPFPGWFRNIFGVAG